MAIATYQDLCIDAVRHTVWINAVPEPVTVEQRVHLDVRATGIEDVAVDPERNDHEIPWSVLADPDGDEFCAFVA